MFNGRGMLILLVLTAWTTSVASSAETYQVHFHAPQVGEEVALAIDLNLELKVDVTQFGQAIDSTSHGLTHRQERQMRILEANRNGATKVQVDYAKATQTVHSQGKPVSNAVQPVAGKSYLVARTGEQLTVTDLSGQTPPEAELQIVKDHLQFLGRPNPLVTFFANRSFKIGQRVKVPVQLAKELLGFGNTVGHVDTFGMTLSEVRTIEGVSCGVFQIDFVAKDNNNTAMTMDIGGELILQLPTGRTLKASLAGPVSVADARGPAGGQYMVNTSGEIRLSTESWYGGKRF